MSIRLTPYVLSLIDWKNFAEDPLRRQYLPLGHELIPDHPELRLDSLRERDYSPVSGLIHRHPDAVLFLWTTSAMLEDAFAVIEDWGFNYKTSFIWDKVKHNMGHYNSVRHELLLVAGRGLRYQMSGAYSIVSWSRSGLQSTAQSPKYFTT